MLPFPAETTNEKSKNSIHFFADSRLSHMQFLFHDPIYGLRGKWKHTHSTDIGIPVRSMTSWFPAFTMARNSHCPTFPTRVMPPALLVRHATGIHSELPGYGVRCSFTFTAVRALYSKNVRTRTKVTAYALLATSPCAGERTDSARHLVLFFALLSARAVKDSVLGFSGAHRSHAFLMTRPACGWCVR